MTARRIAAPLLYGYNTRVPWLRTLARAIDHAAAEICRQQWRHALVTRPQPVRVVAIARVPSPLR